LGAKGGVRIVSLGFNKSKNVFEKCNKNKTGPSKSY
jgi:hypothetical protein